MLLELALGGELFDYVVKRGTLGEDEAASILSDVGDAIRFMHDQGVIHGVEINQTRTRRSSDTLDRLERAEPELKPKLKFETRRSSTATSSPKTCCWPRSRTRRFRP